MISVGNTILNVAPPTIQDELDASSSELQWIVDGYLLLYAGLLLAAGTLGDRFGRRRALVDRPAIFAAGSVLAALSDSASALIASRALMGVGAAGRALRRRQDFHLRPHSPSRARGNIRGNIQIVHCVHSSRFGGRSGRYGRIGRI